MQYLGRPCSPSSKHLMETGTINDTFACDRCGASWHPGCPPQLLRPEGHHWRQSVSPHPVLPDACHEASHADDSGQRHEPAACLCQSGPGSGRRGTGGQIAQHVGEVKLLTVHLLKPVGCATCFPYSYEFLFETACAALYIADHVCRSNVATHVVWIVQQESAALPAVPMASSPC